MVLIGVTKEIKIGSRGGIQIQGVGVICSLVNLNTVEIGNTLAENTLVQGRV